MTIHENYMKTCVDLGRESMRLGNAPVGSIVVLHGEIVGRGLELGKTRNDTTYHAEIEAIRDALNKLKVSKLKGAILYTTHEPCIMCSYVIRHYEIESVYYGLKTAHAGGHSSSFNILQARGIPTWQSPPTVYGGLLESSCQELHNEYLRKKKS